MGIFNQNYPFQPNFDATNWNPDQGWHIGGILPVTDISADIDVITDISADILAFISNHPWSSILYIMSVSIMY